MRLVHRVTTRAPLDLVWELLADPRRWPSYQPLLRRVDGVKGTVSTGDHLLAIARASHLRIPVDVVEAVPGERLVVLIHTVPGVRETLTHELLPTLQGGTSLAVSSVVDGPFARLALAPLWLASGVYTRLLARRVDREAAARGLTTRRTGVA